MSINLKTPIALSLFLFLALTAKEVSGNFKQHISSGAVESKQRDALFHGAYEVGANHYIIIGSCDPNLAGQLSTTLCFLDSSTGRLGALQRASNNTFTFRANQTDVGEVVFRRKQDGNIEGLDWRKLSDLKVFAKLTNSVAYEDVEFNNGNVKLAGRLTKPRTPGPHPAVVMIHGSGNGGRDYAYYSLLATYLAMQDVAVLTYDKRGFGASQGTDGPNTSIQDLADDARAAVEYLKQRKDMIADRIGLYGHSQGGFIAPLVPARGTEVAFMCLLAPPAVNTWDQELNEAENDMRGRGFSEGEVADALKSMRLMFTVASTGQGLDELRAAVQKARASAWWGVVELSSSEQHLEQLRLNLYDPRAALEKLKVPVLALFGERDGIVPPRQNVPIWERYLRAAGNKDFTPRVIPSADHGLFLVRGPIVGHGSSPESDRDTLQMAPGVLEEITGWIARQAGLKVAQSNAKAATLKQTQASTSPKAEIDYQKIIGTYAVGDNETVVVFKFGEFLMLEDFTTGRKGGLFPLPNTPDAFKLVAHGPTNTPVQVVLEQTDKASLIILREPKRPDRRGRKIELRQEEVNFSNGDTKLSGTLIMPASQGPHPAIVFAHGAGPASRVSFMNWAMLFARHGITALAYDKRGTGKSTGDFRTARYEDLANDLVAGVHLLKSRPDIRRSAIGLLGTSQGPWIIGIAAARETDIAFLISSSGGPITVGQQETYRRLWLLRDSGHSGGDLKLAEQVLTQYFEYLRSGGKERAAIVSSLWQKYKDESWFKLLNLPETDPTVGEWPLGRRTFSNELAFDPSIYYRQLKLPVLALFGESDKVVPVQETIAAFKRTLPGIQKGQLTVRVFPGADHGLMLPPLPGDIAHVAPGYFDQMIGWVRQQVNLRRAIVPNKRSRRGCSTSARARTGGLTRRVPNSHNAQLFAP